MAVGLIWPGTVYLPGKEKRCGGGDERVWRPQPQPQPAFLYTSMG